MRLVCPNCDAEYEVDPAVIPSSGRDVQCSNCGSSWFQPSPTAEEAAADEAALFDALPETPEAKDPDSAPKPRGLDESVVAVLREEAEREAAARRAEASRSGSGRSRSGRSIETQTEMGLSAATPAATASPAAQRIALMKGMDPEPRTPRRPQTRREMLPAIEEINSTLRATSERRTGESASVANSVTATRQGLNGFRNGFVLAVLIAVVGVFTYVMAPRIGQQIPGAAPAMVGYVEAVDSARLWLDGVMQQAISALRGLSGDPAG